MKRKFLALILLAITSTALAQQVKIMNLDHPEVSFRGLSVVDNSVLWVSGTKGTIGVSYNGGNSFNWVNPKGYEERDFRAIAALNHSTLLAVAIGSPGIILKTTDSGKSWKEVYRDENPNVFRRYQFHRIQSCPRNGRRRPHQRRSLCLKNSGLR